ncbi:MAG TPA: 30S ribosomal protein S17 [Candidatus Nanopelagicales bacterium]|nr:30S ribosomal protein S17 [Candidatus Nanopelagicales bacterium]
MAKKNETKTAAPKADGSKGNAPATASVAAPAAPPAPAAAAPAVVDAEAPAKAHGFRRKMVGRVTSNKMDKTVIVEVIRNAVDPVYKKYIRQRHRYKAHDEQNQYKIGDRVEITEHRPISRQKRWLVTKLVARAVEE